MNLREAAQQAFDALCDFDYDKRIKAINSLRAALAEPEQEPVAWMDDFGNVFPLGAQRGPKYLNEPMKPLYTHPPQRKPLTDEEIKVIWRDIDGGDGMLMRFVRAVEQAHGIKQEEA